MGFHGTRCGAGTAVAVALLAAAAAGCSSLSGGGSTWEALIQIGTGAQGGNGSIVRLDGAVYRLPHAPAEDPLPFRDAPDSHDPPRWYLEADPVPAEAVLAVESIDIAASAPGDTNGHGEVRIAFPDGDAFRIVDEPGPYRVWLEGRALVRAGAITEVLVEAANSSAAEVRLRGRVLSPDRAAELGSLPFAEAEAPGGVERAGGKMGLVRRWSMDRPRALLQARAGSVGGNPVRVTLLGRGSNHLKRVLPGPLNMEREVRKQDDAIGFAGGGRVPPGKVWVITRIDYEGTANGDSNGPGEFLVQVGDQVIAHATKDLKAAKGVWEGRLEVRPGEEAGVFVQIRNSSTGSATFEGVFE
jgi:hypothetical protein